MWQRKTNSSYFGSTSPAHGGGGMVSGRTSPSTPSNSSGTGFSPRANTSYYPKTSGASGGGGDVSGASNPSGSFGKPIGYVNDDPIGSNTSAARPFGGFGMGSGSFSNKDAGVGGPVNVSSGRNFRPRHFRRTAGGFAGLSRHFQPSGALGSIFAGQQS